MTQTAPLLQEDGSDVIPQYGGGRYRPQSQLPTQSTIQSGLNPMGHSLGGDSEATTPPSSELISNPPIPIPPENLGVSFGTHNNHSIQRAALGASGSGNIAQTSFSNTGANVPAATSSPYSAHNMHQPTSAAAILRSGNMRDSRMAAAMGGMGGMGGVLGSGGGGGGGSGAQHIYSSAHGSVHNELSAHNTRFGSGNYSQNTRNGGGGGGGAGGFGLIPGDGGRYDGMIPLVRQGTFVLIWFAILVAFVACVTTVLLTVKYYQKDTNDADHNSKVTVVRNIRCVVVPLVCYVFDALTCFVFYLESRRLQIHGYSNLHLKTSEIWQVNFGVCSAYFTLAFAVYAFFSNVHSSVGLSVKTLDLMFLVIWVLVFLFIIVCLARFFYLFYQHNRFRPRPNLFDGAASNTTNLHNSPTTSNQLAPNNPKAVIQQLINDKKTLQRQLKNVSAQMTRMQTQLNALGARGAQGASDGKINVATRSPRNSMDGGVGSGRGRGNDGTSGAGLSKQDSLQIAQYEDENRKLRNQVRTLKATIKTCKSEIDTTKTVLDSKKSECDQQKGLIANYERHIANLTQEKEVLENQYNQMMDQKNDNSVLMSVKEEELEWAKKENSRLRQQIIQLNTQMSNFQNMGGMQQHPQQNQRFQR